MKENNGKYNIGDRLVDYKENLSLKRDLTILDKKTEIIKTTRTRKTIYYKYRCNICNWDDGWAEEEHLYYKKQGCACCNGKTVVKGINDLATTHPDLIEYFKDKNEAYMYTAHSDYCPKLICPHCGYEKTTVRLRTLTKGGFGCNICSDGVSYSEKFIHAFLRQLNIEYKWQLTRATYKWCGKYRYDFWFKYNDEEYIVEVHGEQHYKDRLSWTHDLSDIQENDKVKKELAMTHGFDDNHYIVLNCEIPNLNWIKKSIYNSIIANLFDLSKINWKECHECSVKSLVKEVCKYWEDNKSLDISVPIVAKYFDISETSVRKYLNDGAQLNWCTYNGTEENVKSSKRTAKKVLLLNSDMNVIKIFSSRTELEEKSIDLLGVFFHKDVISDICTRKNNHYYKGYYFWYLGDYIKQYGDSALSY